MLPWGLNIRQIRKIRNLSTALTMAVFIAVPANSIRAAEIKVVSADVFTGVLDEVAKEFTHISGYKVGIEYRTAGQVKTRIQLGEFADVMILNRPQIDDLLQQKKVVAASIVNFARSGVGVECAPESLNLI
jgi:molybdate transport system substrate-binding protein